MASAGAETAGIDGASKVGADSTGPPRPDRVPLWRHWDRVYSYDLIRRSPEDEPVEPEFFVGHRQLRNSLATMIADDRARGSILVSGYRGAGKTTLIVQAMLLARQQLLDREPAKHLFAVPINISEVSASLRPSTARDDSQPDQVDLHIDPRRLLAAVIREINSQIARLPKRAMSDAEGLTRLATDAQIKATASEFVATAEQASSESVTRERSSTLSLNITNVLQLVGSLLAVGAVASLVSALSTIAAVATVLAGTAAVTLGFSHQLTKKSEQMRTRNHVARFDNSLHQIESDLKDILAKLGEEGFRTVVILEELDKLHLVEGKQSDLEQVIRYFKNLFTQAPALFFFVTDKDYFDTVSAEIKKRRREGTYAIEHTFFTRRVFVSRPTARDCFDFIRAALREESDRKRIDALKEADGFRTRSIEAMDDRLEQFVRALVFQADNHLFDLKNELYRYVHTEDGKPQLVFDEASFSEAQAKLAVFQFFVEKKARVNRFPGNPYADELLHNALYHVFSDTDEGSRVDPAALHPVRPAPEVAPSEPDAAEDHADRGDTSQLAALEQLTPSEERQLRDALHSMLEEMKQARLLVEAHGEAYQWTTEPTVVRFVERTEAHEVELARRLNEIATALRSASRAGRLLGIEAPPTEADATALEKRATQLLTAEAAELSVTEADEEGRQASTTANGPLAEICHAHVSRLRDFIGNVPPEPARFPCVHLAADPWPTPGEWSSGRTRSLSVILVYSHPEVDSEVGGRLHEITETLGDVPLAVVWIDPTATGLEIDRHHMRFAVAMGDLSVGERPRQAPIIDIEVGLAPSPSPSPDDTPEPGFETAPVIDALRAVLWARLWREALGTQKDRTAQDPPFVVIEDGDERGAGGQPVEDLLEEWAGMDRLLAVSAPAGAKLGGPSGLMRRLAMAGHSPVTRAFASQLSQPYATIVEEMLTDELLVEFVAVRPGEDQAAEMTNGVWIGEPVEDSAALVLASELPE